jgi:hypothetical protein
MTNNEPPIWMRANYSDCDVVGADVNAASRDEACQEHRDSRQIGWAIVVDF